jgi:putative RNA 2'-phosphotransferase
MSVDVVKVSKFLSLILRHDPGKIATATKVGQRHGRPVVLTVRTRQMHAAGHKFFLSANGVWLTEKVPAEFLEFPR